MVGRVLAEKHTCRPVLAKKRTRTKTLSGLIRTPLVNWKIGYRSANMKRPSCSRPVGQGPRARAEVKQSPPRRAVRGSLVCKEHVL